MQHDPKNSAAREEIERAPDGREPGDERLTPSQHSFREIATFAPVGIFETDASGDCLYVNERWCRLAGMTAAEALGKGWVAALHPDDRERVQAGWYDAAAAGREFACEYRFQRSDGTQTWVSGTAVELRDAAGAVSGYLGTVTDVDERKRAEEALVMQSRVLESMVEGVSLSDESGTILYTNPAEDAMFGYERGELVGQHVSIQNTYPPEENARIVGEVIGQLKAHGEWSGEFSNRRKDGTPFTTFARITALEIGGRQHWVCVQEDVTERKRAEAAARDRDELLRLIADAVPSLIAYVDAEGRFRFNNLAYERWFGRSREELYGKHLRELIGDEAWQSVRHHVEAALSGEEVEYEQELAYPRPGTRFVNASYAPHRDETGRVLGYAALVNDITEAKRAEQAVRESESRFRLAASVEALTLFEQDLELRYTWVYPQHPEFPENNIGRTDSELAPREDAERLETLKRQVLETGVGLRQEARVALPDGVRWYDLLIEPRRGEDGAVVGVAGVAIDITERKRAEEARAFLAEATDVLTSSLDHEATLARVARLAVPHLADWCSVHVAEEDGALRRLAVAHVDPAKVAWADDLERRYPPRRDALTGIAAVVRTGKSELYAEIPDALLVEAAVDEEHLAILREVGFTSAMIVPLGTRDRIFGAITLVSAETKRRYTPADLAVAEDLARRAALAIENATLYRDALESSRLKDEFLATVSHELRTPLNSILGWARLLRAGALDPSAMGRAVEAIERNARGQAQIIEDLLDVSRIITGKLRLDVRPLDLTAVTQAAMDAIRPAAALKSIRLESHLTEPVTVSGDAGRLQQVVWNLLSNAIRFTPAGGRVDVRLEREGDRARLEVEDTGAGIAPEFLPYVFDRFRQEDGTTTRKHGGLGLGLAIVRHLVESHGGTVHVRSGGPGCGAAFSVTLPAGPLVADPSGEHLVAESELATDLGVAPSLDGVRVLVVDDEPDTRDLIATVLRHAGARVETAGSVQHALQTLAAETPDLLVSDIGMPGEDGYSLIKKVRSRPPERGGAVPAVALTAYARAEDRIRALSAGYQMHVPKPVDAAEFLVVVASLLSRHASDGSRGGTG